LLEVKNIIALVCSVINLIVLKTGASKVRRLRMSLDSNCLTFEAALNYSDPAVIAGALKSYLREMPDPLMTHKLYNHWMNAANRLLDFFNYATFY